MIGPLPSAEVSPDERARGWALSTWTTDRGRLIFAHPMLATLALHLDLVPVVDQRLPTAATDGRAVYVNPYFLESLSADERLFLLAHEVWHNALLHSSRRREREAELWNVACDHEVNGLLISCGLAMPADGIHFADWAGQSAETVYARLIEKAARPTSRLLRRRNSLTAEEKSPGDRGPSADLHLDPAAAGRLPHSMPLVERHGPIAGKFDPTYPGHRAPGVDGHWENTLVSMADAMDRALAGRLPEALRRVVRSLQAPAVPWQQLLREFVTRSAGDRLGWVPPSRRHIHRGVYLPSRRSDRLRVAVAIDTSDSTRELVTRFLAELSGIVTAFGDYEVRLLQCDAAVHSDELFDASRPLNPSRVTLRGGGGTDFRPVFDRLTVDPPAVLIFLTDGEGLAMSTPPPYPVLWTLPEGGRSPAVWGQTVSIPQR